MEKIISLILEDFYILDPELKKRETELVKIIDKLLSARPKTQFTKAFAKKLEKQILAEININKREPSPKFWKSFIFKPAYFAGGSLLVILILFTAAYYNLINQNSKIFISHVDSKAFGSLTSQNNQNDSSTSLGQSLSAESTVFGRGGGGATAQSSVPGKDMMILPNPFMVNYNYIYKGDEFTQTEESLEVMRKEVNSDAGKKLMKKFSGLDSDLLNMSKFSNTGINNLSVMEDKEFGYMITFNSQDSSISVYANWEKWPRPENECSYTKEDSDECYSRYRLKADDMPSDEEVLTIADQFLNDYGINIDNYGSGTILSNWRDAYESASDKTNYYIPEVLSVSYPLKINGQEVYDESGNPSGLTVEVNTRYKKSSGVYSLSQQIYQSSSYAMETDSDKILHVAQNGGLYGNYQSPDAQKTIDVELGTPTLGLMRYWKYNNGRSEDLYVPAYIFPVLNKPEGLYKQNVVVPLEKEILTQASNNNPIRIMPADTLEKTEVAPDIIAPEESVLDTPTFQKQ